MHENGRWGRVVWLCLVVLDLVLCSAIGVMVERCRQVEPMMGVQPCIRVFSLVFETKASLLRTRRR